MNNKIKYQITTGVILIIVGIALLSINFINQKKDEVFSKMNLALSQETNLSNQTVSEEVEEIIEETSNTETTNEEVAEVPKKEKEQIYNYEPYLGEIEIPKINLYKGFYKKESNLNNVKINLYVMPTSSYPDKKAGNLIIAGHSGNYSNSYFKDLYLLEEDDVIYIHYNNTKYTYQIKKIYLQDKTGTVNIYRNLSKTTLTLITCTQFDREHQTIYIAELIEKE